MRLSDYNTPLSGMLAAQMGLQTTRQNLSNIHTPGYVRQMVNYGSVGARMVIHQNRELVMVYKR